MVEGGEAAGDENEAITGQREARYAMTGEIVNKTDSELLTREVFSFTAIHPRKVQLNQYFSVIK